MKLPGINLGHLDIPEVVSAFLATLRSIDAKLDTLIEAQEEANRNSVMDRLGRTTRERQAFDNARRVHAQIDAELAADHAEHCTAPTCCVQAVATCPVNPTDADLDELRRKLEGQ